VIKKRLLSKRSKPISTGPDSSVTSQTARPTSQGDSRASIARQESNRQSRVTSENREVNTQGSARGFSDFSGDAVKSAAPKKRTVASVRQELREYLAENPDAAAGINPEDLLERR
jgi:hypothetical protein